MSIHQVVRFITQMFSIPFYLHQAGTFPFGTASSPVEFGREDFDQIYRMLQPLRMLGVFEFVCTLPSDDQSSSFDLQNEEGIPLLSCYGFNFFEGYDTRLIEIRPCIDAYWQQGNISLCHSKQRGIVLKQHSRVTHKLSLGLHSEIPNSGAKHNRTEPPIHAVRYS